ncbi:hypothetical protein NKDENANG_01824 [Candidatus Entotheonellaceae bacterium PAL068K]
MSLKSLSIEQYRGFASRTLMELHPCFTLIVGENSTGKTDRDTKPYRRRNRWLS